MTVVHDGLAIHNDGLNIARDAAIDQAADRITHRTIVQRTLLHDDQVGFRTRAQTSQVMAAERCSAAKRRRMKRLASGTSVGGLGSNFADQARHRASHE